MNIELSCDEINEIINALERDECEGGWDHSDIIEKLSDLVK